MLTSASVLAEARSLRPRLSCLLSVTPVCSSSSRAQRPSSPSSMSFTLASKSSWTWRSRSSEPVLPGGGVTNRYLSVAEQTQPVELASAAGSCGSAAPCLPSQGLRPRQRTPAERTLSAERRQNHIRRVHERGEWAEVGYGH